MRTIFCFLLVLVSCTSPNEKTDSVKQDTVITNNQKLTDSANTENKADEQKMINCNSLLKELIIRSNFDTTNSLLDCIVTVDSYENKVYLLKIGVYNSELQNESAIGWIAFDVNKVQLRDVTIDPEIPRYLKFDTVLFNKVISQCLLSNN